MMVNTRGCMFDISVRVQKSNVFHIKLALDTVHFHAL